ncbi:histone deacetylase family protein [Jannaschia seohaensis]|uniref:Acetoin utilization deacetylase AcuC n=1 Tax=Jannaschia seohaensis TaxID=475081 RepID=A0A2Y9C744_9RHOB|nr:histone deacetylase family protein [Jannaschia seohaensis]PWJ20286.1 acetoin utilization deacetylase AcuC-like enzyme [Jannaschia seohaensis]SSA44303.1 Acetoin utilization deacetylase AcuC [Jannaschia seohaensis]
MKAILDTRQTRHDPQNFMANGVVSRSPEQPARIDVLRAAAEAAGYRFEAPSDAGMGPIAAVHSAEYLTFLRTIYPRWQRIEGAAPEVIPNIHPASRTDSYPKSAIGQAGWHQGDTACPIAEHTWESAYWSAQTAITGADLVAAGETGVYALCRPPGHHAFADLAGGFCFLNNSAIAAERLRAEGLRPAILDIDVHHGNGTQGIFYRRGDVLTVSIHADPARFYPFFWGHAHERGEEAGLGANLNLPLPRGTDDDSFLKAMETALAAVESFGTDCLVVALGLDASIDDPFKGFAVTQDGFHRIGQRLKATGLPLLFVQEGGYLSDALGPNLTAFLRG